MPGWSVTARVALFLAIVTTQGCLYTSPVYAPSRPRVQQTGSVRTAAARSREPDDLEYLRARRLAIPVAGVEPEQLRDDFHAPRGGGRRHNAIDILAPYGTPVVAADDGYVLRLSRNRAGGIVLYATDPEERIVYYYAHLAGYHESMSAGREISKGDTIGYVGTSGNAPRDTPHLHFQIMRMRDGGRYWNGQPMNPYPILRRGRERSPEAPVAAQVVTPQATPRPAPRPVPVEPEPPPTPPRRKR